MDMTDSGFEGLSRRAALGAGEGTALIVTDIDGHIVLWNDGAAQLYGWDADEVAGRSVSEVLVPAELSPAAADIMAGLADPLSRGWQGHFRVRRKDGSVIGVYVQDTPIIVDGKVVAVLGESAPVGGLHSLDSDLAVATGSGVRSVVDTRRKWFDSFLAAARSTLSIRELDELLQEVLAAVVNSLNADAASLLVTDESGDALIARSAYGWDAELTRAVRIPAGSGLSGRILASGEPLIVDNLADVDVFSPELRNGGFRSYVGVPLVDRHRVVGVLHATSHERAFFSADDVETLRTLAAPLASAVHRVRQFVRLANGANPTHVAPVAGLDIYARYRAADGGNGGGDWYDVVVCENGTVALVIGDAAGHGIDALAGAGSVRHALVAYLHEGHSPGAALSRLQRLIRAASFGTKADFLTLLACVYDPATRTLRTASAGHPPLLHVRGGVGRFGRQADPPISTALPLCDFAEGELALDQGDLVVLFTDGLIESRGETLDAGLGRLLATAVDRRGLPLPELGDALLDSGGTAADDRSVLLFRPTG